jgi:hypothetical protein
MACAVRSIYDTGLSLVFVGDWIENLVFTPHFRLFAALMRMAFESEIATGKY